MKDENVRLSQGQENIDDRILNLTQEIQKRDGHVQQLQHDLNEAEQSIRQLMYDNTEKANQLSELSGGKQQNHRRLDSASWMSQDKSIDVWDREKTVLEARITRLTKDLMKRKDQNRSLESENADLGKQLEEITTKNKFLNSQIDKLKKTRSKLTIEIDELTEVVDFKDHEIQQLKAEEEKLKQEIVVLKYQNYRSPSNKSGGGDTASTKATYLTPPTPDQEMIAGLRSSHASRVFDQSQFTDLESDLSLISDARAPLEISFNMPQQQTVHMRTSSNVSDRGGVAPVTPPISGQKSSATPVQPSRFNSTENPPVLSKFEQLKLQEEENKKRLASLEEQFEEQKSLKGRRGSDLASSSQQFSQLTISDQDSHHSNRKSDMTSEQRISSLSSTPKHMKKQSQVIPRLNLLKVPGASPLTFEEKLQKQKAHSTSITMNRNRSHSEIPFKLKANYQDKLKLFEIEEHPEETERGWNDNNSDAGDMSARKKIVASPKASSPKKPGFIMPQLTFQMSQIEKQDSNISTISVNNPEKQFDLSGFQDISTPQKTKNVNSISPIVQENVVTTNGDGDLSFQGVDQQSESAISSSQIFENEQQQTTQSQIHKPIFHYQEGATTQNKSPLKSSIPKLQLGQKETDFSMRSAFSPPRGADGISPESVAKQPTQENLVTSFSTIDDRDQSAMNLNAEISGEVIMHGDSIMSNKEPAAQNSNGNQGQEQNSIHTTNTGHFKSGSLISQQISSMPGTNLQSLAGSKHPSPIVSRQITEQQLVNQLENKAHGLNRSSNDNTFALTVENMQKQGTHEAFNKQNSLLSNTTMLFHHNNGVTQAQAIVNVATLSDYNPRSNSSGSGEAYSLKQDTLERQAKYSELSNLKEIEDRLDEESKNQTMEMMGFIKGVKRDPIGRKTQIKMANKHEEFFKLVSIVHQFPQTLLSFKLSHKKMSMICDIDSNVLFDEACDIKLPFYKYPEWIFRKLNDLYERMSKNRDERWMSETDAIYNRIVKRFTVKENHFKADKSHRQTQSKRVNKDWKLSRSNADLDLE